jgi:tetratricopeptide (TPR) repeat protein
VSESIVPSSLPEVANSSTEYGTTTGNQFYDDALAAFRRADYQEAARLAAHALIDMPREARGHELMSLAMFALGNYPAAAMEAHAAVVLGPVADWSTLYSYYENLPAYTTQLETLAKYAHAHSSSMSAWFLLAYHNLMMGHMKAAQDLLVKVVTNEPQDKVAATLLKQLDDHSGKVGGITSLAPQPKP